MTDYQIRIIVSGEDRASGPLRNVGGALGNMGQIAGGILGAGMFMKIANGIQGMFNQSIMATEGLQQMQVGMEGLIARELQQAEAAKMAADGMSLTGDMAKTINDYLPQAGESAKKLMDELERLAVVSPYQVETIQSTFKTAMAFGYTTEEAKKYTEALLNVAAGTGANNEMLGRMSYNFSQIRMQGRVTAVDIRQLAMAGFDLTSVLKSVGDQFGVAINDHLDFNKAIEDGKITWEQFTEGFAKYADQNFGGASERMSRTLSGLRSTFKDVFALTMPKILGPAVEKFTGFAGRFLDSFLKIRESGLLEKAADSLGVMMDNGLKKAEPFLKAFDLFFSTLARGQSPLEALKLAVGTILGVDTIAEALKFQQIWDGISNTFSTVFTFVSTLWNTTLKPALTELWTWLSANIPIAIATAKTWFEQNLLPILVNLATWYQTQLAPALADLYTWFMANIPGALQKSSDFFNQNILPVLSKLWDIISTNVLPVIGDLVVWFTENLPGALAITQGYFDNVILPAATRLWAFIQDSILPIIEKFWTWLQENLPGALQKVSDFLNNTLLPALDDLWAFIDQYVWPIIDELVGIFGDLISLGFEALAGVWENVLWPALKELWSYLSETLGPIFEDFVTWLGDVTGGIDGIKETLSGWLSNLRDLRDLLANIKLPDWLTPGSPTPLELGIKGITGALAQLNKSALPKFDAGLSNLPAGAGAGSSGGNITIGEVKIYAQPGQDGAALYKQFKDEMERDKRDQRSSGLGSARV